MKNDVAPFFSAHRFLFLLRGSGCDSLLSLKCLLGNVSMSVEKLLTAVLLLGHCADDVAGVDKTQKL